MRKSNIYIFSMIVLIVVTAVIMLLSCIQMFIDPNFNMANWVTIIALGIFSIVMLVYILLEKFHVRKIGFYLLHAGLILILIGSFMYFLKGQSYQITFPVDNSGYYKVIATTEENEKLDLLMDIKVMDAVTEYYPPTYSVYQIDTSTGDMSLTAGDLELINGYLDLGAYGGTRMSQEEIQQALTADKSTGANYFYITANTAVIQNITPKHYEAKVVLASAEYEEFYGSESAPLSLTVNHPLRKGGWKIYLLAVGGSGDGAQVTFLFKKDPGEIMTYVGIGMLVLGSFISCFMRPAKKKEEKK